MSSLNNRPSYLDNEFPLQAIETEKTFSIMLIPSQEFASLTILRPCGFCLFLTFPSYIMELDWNLCDMVDACTLSAVIFFSLLLLLDRQNDKVVLRMALAGPYSGGGRKKIKVGRNLEY
jgi:hypothetical protein